MADLWEKAWRTCREWMLGTDPRIFDRTIRFYREVYGQNFTPREAMRRALDKSEHKACWYNRPRDNVEAQMHFYKEVHVYPFRQPYNKRLGGFRWCRQLVRHFPQPRMLEYGCGSAVWTEYMLARFPECQFVVADIPSVTLDFVLWKKRAYNLPYEVLTIGPGRPGIPLQGEYDLIVCQDVLEHTPNPLEICEAFVNHLSFGGVLLLDFLNDPGGENLWEAVAQRERCKRLLGRELVVVKGVDEGGSVDGLYFKPLAGAARQR